jgi:methylenetetrahydrofolate dehydrogenase (NADP+)/methenyltetrahydrofolate cyclohydrolase
MAATLLDGSAVARQVREEVQQAYDALRARHGVTVHLAVVQVGHDEAASVYVRRIVRSFEQADMLASVHALPADVSPDEFQVAVRNLSEDDGVHGIIIQTPLPRHLTLEMATSALDPRKDVDGVHPMNAGLLAQGLPGLVPATPLGGIELLERAGIPIAGKRAVVVGRSNIVGKPMALLLLQRDATVTICHSKTVDLPAVTREADILVAAIGRPRFVTADMVKPGAVVVDFGINVVDDQVVGDVDFDAVRAVAGAITPVPGGTGPMTNAVLLRNTLRAAERLVRA